MLPVHEPLNPKAAFVTCTLPPDEADLTLTASDPDVVAGFLAGASMPAAALSPEGDLSLLKRLPAIFPLRA